MLDWFGDETDSFSAAVDLQIAGALEPFTIQPPSVWCPDNIRLAPGRTSMPGKLKLFDYQKEVLDTFADPSVRRVVVPKGSRTGYNLLLACWQIYCAANSRDPIVSVHPIDKSSRTHEETIRSMILNSPKLLRLIPDIEDQRWEHKRFLTGAELFFKEATKAGNFAEYSARNAAADEVDRPAWADGGESVSEGEKLDLLEVRLASYVPFGLDKMVIGASPGSDATSRVWPRFMLTDQRKLFMPCPVCGEFHHLKWGGRETDYGVKWKDDPTKAVYVCEDCGGVWSEKDRKAALREAQWRPTAQGIPGWVGFHMTGLMSPFWSLGELAKEFDKSTKMAAQGRLGSLQAFINTKLGETWKDRDAKAPAAVHALQERVEHYPAEVPADCRFVLAYADTQNGKVGEKSYHEVGFYGVAPGEQFYHIGQFIVREHGLEDDRHWEQLEALLARPWKHASGRAMPALLACVDSGSGDSDYSHRVIRFCNDNERKHKRMWYATKGHSNVKGERKPTIWPHVSTNARRGGYLHLVDTYRAKDYMYERLKREPGTPGSVHFPSAHIEGALPVDSRFFKRLTKERPKIVPGQDATSWAKQPSDQEPWDCLVGCYIGLEALYTKPGGNKLRAGLQSDAAHAVPPVKDRPDTDAPSPEPAAEAPENLKRTIGLPPPGTPPWKMTPEERAAVAAAKEAEQKAAPVKGHRSPLRFVSSKFVSN